MGFSSKDNVSADHSLQIGPRDNLGEILTIRGGR